MPEHHGEALQQYLREKNISKTELSDKLEVSRGTLYLWFSKKELPLDTLEILRSHIGFNPYLGNNTSVQSVGAGKKMITGQVFSDTTHRGNIIYVPAFAYGGFLTGYRNPVFIESLDHFRLPGITGEHYAFEISGMSMYKPGDEKSAASGDIAISRPVEEFKHMAKGKGYILQTVDGIIYKEFAEIKNEVAHFTSINKEFEGRKLPLREIKKVYFVNFILKKTY